MTQRTEEQYFDQLMQLEFAVLGFFDDHPDLTDAVVDSAYEELAKRYRAEATAHEYKPGKLDGLRLELHDTLLPLAEMLVGRPDNVMPYAPVSAQAMQDVFKRLRASIKRWGKVGGRQAYLNFIGGQLGGLELDGLDED
ncbi:hypothetical protein [Deinococcus sp. PESE-13]